MDPTLTRVLDEFRKRSAVAAVSLGTPVPPAGQLPAGGLASIPAGSTTSKRR